MIKKISIITVGTLILVGNINASIISEANYKKFKQEKYKQEELEKKQENLQYQKDLKLICKQKYNNKYIYIAHITNSFKKMPTKFDNEVQNNFYLMNYLYDGIFSNQSSKIEKKFLDKYLTKKLMEKFLNPNIYKDFEYGWNGVNKIPLINYMIKKLGGEKYVIYSLRKDTPEGLFVALQGYENNPIIQKEIFNSLDRMLLIPYSNKRNLITKFFQSNNFNYTLNLIGNSKFKTDMINKIKIYFKGPQISKKGLGKLNNYKKDISKLSQYDYNFYKMLIKNHGYYQSDNYKANIKAIRLYSKYYPLFIAKNLQNTQYYKESEDINLFINYAAFIKQNYKKIDIRNLYIYYIRVLTYKNSNGIGFDTQGIKQLLEFNSDFKNRLTAIVKFYLLNEISDELLDISVKKNRKFSKSEYKDYYIYLQYKKNPITIYGYDLDQVKLLSEKSNKVMVNEKQIINKINNMAKNHTFKQTKTDFYKLYYNPYLY